MDAGKEQRMKEAGIFFWGIFWGVTTIGINASWVIKIILFLIFILAWIYYIFFPPPFRNKAHDNHHKQRENT